MSLISSESIQDILRRLDIVDVISEYVPLKRAGQSYKGLCPFHNEKSPSFNVRPDKQMYYCFGCGVGGDLINFLMRLENLMFPEAMERLALRLGVELVQEDEDQSQRYRKKSQITDLMDSAQNYFYKMLCETKAGEPVLDYLKERGLNLETIKDFHLGYAPEGGGAFLRVAKKSGVVVEDLVQTGMVIARDEGQGHYDRFRDRMMIPISDVNGKVIAFGGRALRDGQPKYLNSPETFLFNKSKTLFGLDKTKKELMQQKTALVVEGYMDFIKLYQSGIKNIVACLGTGMTTQQALLLKRFVEDVIMIYDSDKAGQVAALRGGDVLLRNGLHAFVVTLDGAKDPDEFIDAFGSEAFLQFIEEKKEDYFDYKFSCLCKDHDVNTELGKARIAEELFVSIQGVDNKIVQGGLLKRISSMIGIDLLRVEGEFEKKMRLGSSRAPRLWTANKGKPAAMDAAERILLILILRDQSYFDCVKKFVKKFDLTLVNEAFTVLFDLFELVGYVKNVDLSIQIADESMGDLLASLTMDETILEGTEQKNLEGCLKAITLQQLNDRIRILDEEVRMMRGQEKPDVWRQKVALQNELLRQKQKINQEGIFL
jgi:DNA primase